MINKEAFKNRIVISFGIALVVSLAVYFGFRAEYSWVSLIVPEFLGICILAILVAVALKKNVSFHQYLVTLLIIFSLGIIGFVYGRTNNIKFLVDLSPELLGSSGLGLLFSTIYRKRIFK